MDWLWLRMLASLLLIVGLIVATLWVMKRFMTFGKPALGVSGVAMEVAGVLHLAPRKTVYAVRAGTQVILLGVADQSVTFLTELPESACVQSGAAAPVQAFPGMSPFLRILTDRFKTAAPQSAVDASESSDGTTTTAATVKKSRTAPRKKVSTQS